MRAGHYKPLSARLCRFSNRKGTQWQNQRSGGWIVRGPYYQRSEKNTSRDSIYCYVADPQSAFLLTAVKRCTILHLEKN